MKICYVHISLKNHNVMEYFNHYLEYKIIVGINPSKTSTMINSVCTYNTTHKISNVIIYRPYEY